MEWLLGLVALTAMEIVLGIDNVIFIVILASRLPEGQRHNARRVGLLAALGTRLMLLMSISWIIGMTEPVFSLASLGIPSQWLAVETLEFSWRDLILLAGGLFLIGKSVHEIHKKFEENITPEDEVASSASFSGVVLQIALIDIVFSLDSVITAVGMVKEIWVMITAVCISIAVMLKFAGAIAGFVERHPTLKILALAFLILIGVMLVGEGLGQHLDKGYIYFAMAFSIAVEAVNVALRSRKKSQTAPSSP